MKIYYNFGSVVGKGDKKVKIKSKVNLFLVLVVILSQMNGVTAFGHRGRTDSNGGHRDNKNVSGLGSYHYHHGYSAHLHPNGICPYDSSYSNATTSVDTYALKKEAENEGYSAGYQDGKEGSMKNSSQYSTQYRESFDSGYTNGYEKGREEFLLEQESVKLQAEEAGYQSGYKNAENTSTDYSGVHAETYKTSYNLAYNKGQNKRKEEIQAIEDEAKKLGEIHGYNKENNQIDYVGDYKDEYYAAYEKGLVEGEKRLEQDLLEVAKENFKQGMLGIEADFETYENIYLKEEAINSYEQGNNIYDEVVLNRPILGQRLKFYTEYAKDKKYIRLGLSEENEETLIIIGEKWGWLVRNIQVLVGNLIEDGLEAEDTKILLENLLSGEVLRAYEESTTQKKKDDDYTYNISKMKRVNKIEKCLPRNFYLITKVKGNKVVKIEINKKIPSELKKLESI